LPFATKIQAGAINNKGSVVVFAHQNLVHVVTAANDGFKFRNVLVPLARLNKTVQDITFLGNTDTCILLLKDELQANPCELIVFDPHTVAEPSTAPTTFSLGAVTSGTAKDSFLVSLDDKKFGVIGSNAQSLLFFEHNKNRLKLKASRSLEKPCKYARVIKSNATSRLGIICEPEKSSNRSYFDVQGVFVRKNEILSEESETLVAKFIKEFGKQEWSHAAYLHLLNKLPQGIKKRLVGSILKPAINGAVATSYSDRAQAALIGHMCNLKRSKNKISDALDKLTLYLDQSHQGESINRELEKNSIKEISGIDPHIYQRYHSFDQIKNSLIDSRITL